jgi:purine-binding chemotaxis protein CheW
MGSQTITETRQYLTFELSGEIFALDVSNVREILEVVMITKVPRMPDYMAGVVNLRGSVVPVLDMRLKFGLTPTEMTVDTCIVVVEVPIHGERMTIGALVDSVREVFEFEPESIEPAPKIGTHLKTEFIKGMGKKDDGFIIILDAEAVFSLDVQTAAGEAEPDGNTAQTVNE